jgi:hypothetical protein
MHLQKSLRENSVGRRYAAQTATQFLQSKTQQMPGRAASGRRSLDAPE